MSIKTFKSAEKFIMKSILLIGNGGHCKSCIEIIESTKNYKIKGIIIQSKENVDSFLNYKVIGNDENIYECFDKDDSALICVGQIKSPDTRIKLFNILVKNKISLAKVTSRYAIISKYSSIESGSIIMHNAIINAGAKIGFNCIINNNTLIEHDSKIGNHCHISTGVIVNGNTTIGDECFIGSGSIIREGVKIGNRVIISAGQIIMKDIPSNTIFKG